MCLFLQACHDLNDVVKMRTLGAFVNYIILYYNKYNMSFVLASNAPTSLFNY